ncbi:MAG: GntR family transcriptional regulator [Deltaproteobacteria bacterium]
MFATSEKKILAKSEHSGEQTDRLAPIVRPALPNKVIARLRQMIEDGELIPGSRVPERRLCEQFGVSRTPMREALRALAAEGLLEIQAHRGATVRKFKPEDIDHMFQVLEVLEALAGELACEAMTPDELSEMERLHGRMMKAYARHDRRTFFKLNQQIHELLVLAAHNPALTRIYDGLSGQTRRTRFMANSSDVEWSVAAEEHEKIMQALKSRRPDAVQLLLRTHLRHKRERVKALLAR